MSYEIFTRVTSTYDGASCQFCQGDYLSDFSGIKAKRLSSNFDTVVYGNFSGDNELCLGFVLLMIEQHFHFGRFLSTVKTTEGKGKVRGYAFIQYMRALTKTGKSKTNAPIGMGEEGGHLELVTDNSEAASFALANGFDRMGFMKSDTGVLAGLAPFIRLMANRYFYLSINGCDGVGGHAIALVNTPKGFGVFDPNFGMATFRKRKSGTKRFCSFLNAYTKLIYRESLSESYIITAFRSKEQSIATMRLICS